MPKVNATVQPSTKRSSVPALALTILALTTGGIATASATKATVTPSESGTMQPLKGVIGDFGLE